MRAGKILHQSSAIRIAGLVRTGNCTPLALLVSARVFLPDGIDHSSGQSKGALRIEPCQCATPVRLVPLFCGGTHCRCPLVGRFLPDLGRLYAQRGPSFLIPGYLGDGPNRYREFARALPSIHPRQTARTIRHDNRSKETTDQAEGLSRTWQLAGHGSSNTVSKR